MTIINTSWNFLGKSLKNNHSPNMNEKIKPIVILSNPEQQCVTFFWKNNPHFYVGYRFVEHSPEIIATPLSHDESLLGYLTNNGPEITTEKVVLEKCDPWDKNWITQYVERDARDNIQLSFKTFIDGSAWACSYDLGGAQKREFFFNTVETGVIITMRLTTDVPIPGAFCVQQCLRMTGNTNKEWRRRVALTPFLSEFDTQAQGNPNLTLTYVRKEDSWLRFPVSHTKYHTHAGLPLLMSNSGGQIDHGLIVRESQDEKYSAGMYWERTAYVSNRHPADCIHACIDMGPLRVDEQRTVHGKFYFIEGPKDKLLKIWQSDFRIKD
jgi:hypothetical protein